MKNQTKMRTRAQNLRKNMTSKEKKLLYQFLKTYPVQFKRQFQIGCYIVDFYCYRAKVIVELDGSQHCEPEVVQYDHQRTMYLENQGFIVIRIPNTDINQNFRAVCEYIDRIVRSRCG